MSLEWNFNFTMQFHIKDINFVDDFFIIFTRSKEYDILLNSSFTSGNRMKVHNMFHVPVLFHIHVFKNVKTYEFFNFRAYL